MIYGLPRKITFNGDIECTHFVKKKHFYCFLLYRTMQGFKIRPGFVIRAQGERLQNGVSQREGGHECEMGRGRQEDQK